ncbi:hypothetical protein niasHS_008015 [Heterodera schachtii]|uniref:Effector protein n=1 Tax=Heterodera schachtii TaxID=97005 RepID=A0ABD2JCM6_HETSC
MLKTSIFLILSFFCRFVSIFRCKSDNSNNKLVDLTPAFSNFFSLITNSNSGIKSFFTAYGLNGQYREIRGVNESTYFYFECFRREGETKSFWGYWKDKSKDPIRISDFQCLDYKQGGIVNPPSKTVIDYPLRFKSANTNE